MNENKKNIFERLESNVQSYARSFPSIFDKASGAELWDADGNRYLDFLAGAGSLNYGHNNKVCRQALLDYINSEGITHSLDLHTEAKADFLSAFEKTILKPRRFEYLIQFPSPTGTNAVEAALKIARRVTGRTNIISFTNGFHGCSLGALAATGAEYYRNASGLPLSGMTSMPFDKYYGEDVNTIDYMDKLLSDPSSGIDKPAAVLVETVQGEGGFNVASKEWMLGLQALCKQYGMLLIVDDIQAGCGRAGNFFSFDKFNIQPDIVLLSKSLSGYGLPLSIVLLKKELDCWKPGEHNGTFRGNNHAFVTATAVLNHYWQNDDFVNEINVKHDYICDRLNFMYKEFKPHMVDVRGRGMMMGIKCKDPEKAESITRRAFRHGLIMERCGPFDEVIKCMMPLTTNMMQLQEGLDILELSMREEFVMTVENITESRIKQPLIAESFGAKTAA
jgi:diaminobutyrate-2-oxoglutarate transaminase